MVEFKRFTLNQRIEHILFFTSFIILAYTGFPLKFPDEWWARWMIASIGGFDNRTLIHHFAGLIMIGVSVYHVIYHTIFEKPRFDILFNVDDIRQFLQQMRYNYRLSDIKPAFGRYTWKQKFEYFGAGFGAVIMGITGILMWHPFEAMKYFPLGIIQVANLFHTWEAVLASIAVFIGHFYDEHIEKFLNMSWLTGNISEEEMMHEHPAEYSNIMGDESSLKHLEKTNIGSDKTIVLGLGKLLTTIIFLVISIWMLYISYRVLSEAISYYT
jgi:cytochrome b subunit of formate dehydrogenase